MLQRLILPLAWRSLLLSIVVAGIAFVFIAPVRMLRGQQTMSGTLREFSAGVSWSGKALASNATFDPATCATNQTCEVFTLNVDVSDEYRQRHPNFALLVRITWEDLQNDFDLFVSREGRIIDASTQNQTDSEELRIDRPHNGIYHVFTSTTALLSATEYRGSATVVGAVRSPEQRNSRYLKDPDGRTGPLMFQFAPEIQRPTGNVVPGARTSIAIDAFGNTYIAADGSSLTLGDDTGRTFDKPSVIKRLADPHVSAGQGNLVVNSDGTVYNVYTSTSHNELFLATCESRCDRFVTRRIFSGASGMTLAHPYPVLAVDNSGGLHVVFNNGRTVFLMSSADGGATWKDAATVNNPDDPETSSASSPWVFAGDSGRLGIVWTGPRGNTYYAFTHDAFSAVPAFSYVDVGDPEPNAGLPSGAADPFGDASIVYGSGRFVRQVSGERLISGLSLIETGVLKTDTGAKRLSLITRQDQSGRLIFLDEERRISLRSTQFTAFTRHNETVSISGKGVLQDGTAVSFTVVVSDAAGRAAQARNLLEVCD